MRPLLFAALILGSASSLSAQKLWNGGDGVWTAPESWVGGVIPNGSTGTSHVGQFRSSVDPVTVDIGGEVLASAIYIDYGAKVIFDLAAGADLQTGSIWRIGTEGDVGDGAASFTIKGPATGVGQMNQAEGKSNQFGIKGGSEFILEGPNLKVTFTGASTIGNGANESGNTFKITSGATFTNNALRVGQTTAGAGGASGNSVVVEGGGKVFLNGASANSSIGGNVDHHSNSIEVTGANSEIELGTTANLMIGSAAGTNKGGNFLSIKDGGKVTSLGVISIKGYTAGSTDYGSNRLVIDDGGMLSLSSTITVGHTEEATFADALLQLAEGGILEGTGSILVHNGARFEATGEGLGADIQTTIKAGGMFAASARDATSPAVLALKSEVTFEEDALLRIALYENGISDVIDLSTGASLDGHITLKLDLGGIDLEEGQSWTFFTGETSLITATFDMDNLDLQIWDISRFNEAGNWELRVIPEPSAVGLLVAGAGFLAWSARRRKRVLSISMPLLLLSVGLHTAALAADEQEIIKIQSEEVEIAEKSDMKFTVNLNEAPADSDRVLEFTAWYQAPKVAGYYAGMRVFWNGEEMEDILDRPATFKTLKGSEVPVRRGKMWQVAVLPGPEETHGEGRSRSYVAENVDVVRFRFRIPPSHAGEHEIEIRNSMSAKTKHTYEVFPTLIVRELEVRTVAK